MNKKNKKQEQAKEREPNPRREELKSLSASLKIEARLNGLDLTTNEMILLYYEKKQGTTDLRTFEQWKKEGYFVKKGEKSFVVWSRPIETKKKGEGESKDKESKNDSMFGICHLFDISQVKQNTPKGNN